MNKFGCKGGNSRPYFDQEQLGSRWKIEASYDGLTFSDWTTAYDDQAYEDDAGNAITAEQKARLYVAQVLKFGYYVRLIRYCGKKKTIIIESQKPDVMYNKLYL